MRGFLENKRGQLVFGLSVLVAVGLFGFTLFYFVSFNETFTNRAFDYSEMMREVEFNYQYALAETSFFAREAILSGEKDGAQDENYGEKFVELAKSRKSDVVWYEKIGNLILKIENGEFKFEKSAGGKEYSLEIKGLFVNAQNGIDSVKKNFDVLMKFDDLGNEIN